MGAYQIHLGAFPAIASFFLRGDVNFDGGIDVADPLTLLGIVLFDVPATGCASASDSNDDGLVNLADPIYLLNYLFQQGPEPPAPFVECGFDPTPDTPCDAALTGC